MSTIVSLIIWKEDQYKWTITSGTTGVPSLIFEFPGTTRIVGDYASVLALSHNLVDALAELAAAEKKAGVDRLAALAGEDHV